jgi:predicted Zn-dependent protease
MFRLGWNWLGRNTTYPKEPIWIPNKRKVEEAFQEYVKEIQKRGAQPGENVRVENGKVSIQGVGGVMAINGIISRMIFDENKNKHSFYVEESYVIGWMYPHLEPFQVIMKINREPLPKLTPEMVKRDRDFWDEYTAMLQADHRFKGDTDAQKSFSKLRTAIAGLYSWRGSAGPPYGQPELNTEAEYAFRQALTMCPDSPETNFRFVELLSRQERFDDALDVLGKFRKLDPLNMQIVKVEENVKNLKKNVEELSQWEERYKADPTNVEVCMRLIQYYGQRGRVSDLDRVVDNALKLPAVTSNQIIQLAQMYAQPNYQRLDRVAIVLEVLTKRFPDMAAAWYDLAVVNSVLYRGDQALNALQEAITRGGDKRDDFRNQAKQDQRLDHVRTMPRFKEIVGE